MTIKVAVYTICKNEEQHMAGWLSNTADADCRFVGDTGCTDRSMRILDCEAEPTDFAFYVNVQPFRFDMARNAVLAAIPGNVDVCISLDMDERLNAGWRQALERVWADEFKPNIVEVKYQTPMLAPFYHNSRIHARHGFFWHDPCHEALRPWDTEMRVARTNSIWIDHLKDDKKDRGGYFHLLAAGVKEEPTNSRRVMYYARELMIRKQFELAIQWFDVYFKLRDGQEEDFEYGHAMAYKQICAGAIKELAEKANEQQ